MQSSGPYGRLPAGVEVYRFTPAGRVERTDWRGLWHTVRDDEFLRFIDEGQRARYFVGDEKTSPERPSNATYKLGVVESHSAFTPHAHGGEHYVLSLGYASCGLYDLSRDRLVDIRLSPGMLVRIPEMVPHSFANRAGRPLVILAANTGFGIDHEDYAITAAEADRRGAVELAGALRRIEREQGSGRTTWRERLAAGLHRLAATLEREP